MSASNHQGKSSALLAQTDPVLAPGEIMIGQLQGLDDQGNPLVDYDCNPEVAAQVAVSTLPVTRQQIGRQVALLFASGDLRKPVIMGFIHNPLDELLESFALTSSDTDATAQASEPAELAIKSPLDAVVVDGKKLVIESKEEIVLRCGESSITLNQSGKIVIRGKYLLSRASGVNRILGGSVQVN